MRDNDEKNGITGALVEYTTPAGIVLFATWTFYVHVLSLTHGSFATLLRFLPFEAVAATAVALLWIRFVRREPDVRASNRLVGSMPSLTLRGWVFFGVASIWVAVYAITRNFTLFWWGAVAVLGIVRTALCGGDNAPAISALPPTRREALLLVILCLIVAIITLVANRPDIDDSFYLSIPATLLRDPLQPILLHDTLYRLPSLPIEFVAYREHTYEVLIGVVAWITGLAPITVGHLVFPPVFAVLALLAWAWLLRMWVPRHWLATLGLLVLCMLLLGETHHAYGNFGFVRIFQGKAIELCWSVPAIIGCALVWMRSGRLDSWLLLMASQVAAIGITSTGLFVAPLASGLALAGGWSPNAVSSRRVIIGCCASWYVVVVGALLAVTKVGGHVWSPGYTSDLAPLGKIITETWGVWSTLPLLLALLTAWAFCESRSTARTFVTVSMLFLLVCFDPYLYGFMADHVMGESAFWRLSWTIPLPLMLAVMIRAILAQIVALPVPWRGWKWIIWAVAGMFTIWVAQSVGTLRTANHVALGAPRVKAPVADYALADRLVHEMPESSTLLAPVAIASWCSTFVKHPQLLSVRPMYLLSVARELGQANAKERYALQLYVSGWKRESNAVELLRDGVSRYHLQTVVVAHAAPWAEEAGETLSNLGFDGTENDNYTIWTRRP